MKQQNLTRKSRSISGVGTRSESLEAIREERERECISGNLR
jgi:hypothetical protein